MFKLRGSKARQDLYINRLHDALLYYTPEQIQEQWGTMAVGAAELRESLDATNCGATAMTLSKEAADVMAYLAWGWLDYYEDMSRDCDQESKRIGRSRAGLSQRIMSELYNQGIAKVVMTPVKL
jgi:hypothetical protein